MHLGSHAFGKVISHVRSFAKGLDREVAAWLFRAPSLVGGLGCQRRAVPSVSAALPTPARSALAGPRPYELFQETATPPPPPLKQLFYF